MFFKRITGQFSKTQVALHSLQRRLEAYTRNAYVRIEGNIIQERASEEFELQNFTLLHENPSKSHKDELTAIGREELATIIDNLESFQQCEELFFGNRYPIGMWGNFAELPTEVFAVLYTGRNHALIQKLIAKVNQIVSRSSESLGAMASKVG